MSSESGQPAQRFFHPDLAPPQAEPTEPEAEEEESLETTSEESSPPEVAKVFVGGREQTVEEVISNYQRSSDEAIRLKAQLDGLKAVMEERERQAQAPPPPQPISPPDLENASAQEIQAWIAQEAKRQGQEAATQAVGPQLEQMQQFFQQFQKLNEAQVEMKRIDSGFDPGKLDGFLAAHPEVQERYNRMFAADQLAALDWAWSQVPKQGTAEPSRAVQKPVRHKKPAPSPADHKKKLQAALLEAERTGDWKPYYALRFEGTSVDRFKAS